MPYRKAYVYVLALLVMAFVAFWPSYLKDLPGGKMAWHFHAASAVLWTLLAAFQSWSIHHDRWSLHRAAGLAVFVLFPAFLIAGLWVIHVEATTLAADLTDPEGIAQIGPFDSLANVGFAILLWGGLRYRYKVQLHARYMLATLLFVVAPILWRLLRGFSATIRDMSFSYPFAVANLAAFAIALTLYLQAPKHGRPFLLAATVIAMQEILFETLGRLPAWAPVFASVADVNLPLLLTLTGIVSLGIAWHGWVAGARPTAPRTVAAA